MASMTFSPLALSSRVAPRVAGRAAAKASKASFRVKASLDESMPAEAQAVAAPAPVSKFEAFKNTMSFGAWAPETINGRVAQIAFVAGLGAELSTGESFTSQFAAHTGAIAFASGLITLASFMPSMQNADGYKADPATLKPGKPWTIDAEKANGRGAMIGLVSMLVLEKVIGGPITGLFGGASDSFGNADQFYDDSFKAQVEVPVAMPAASSFADFDAPVAAAAPAVVVEDAAAVDAVVAYEAAVVAEPVRVEGAVVEEVEAAAMELGREVSAAQDAAADAVAVEM